MDETTYEDFLDYCDERDIDPEDPQSRVWYDAARDDAAETFAEMRGEAAMEYALLGE